MITALIDLVQSKQAITDVIGNRFYPRILPQGLSDFPSVTFRWNSSTDTADFSGASTFDFASVDLHCYARSYGKSLELWELLRKELEEQSGPGIDHIWYVPSGAEDYLEELELYTKQLELKISYRRNP